MSHHTQSFQYGPNLFTIETGEMARQADAAVLVSVDGTVVLVTAVGAKSAVPGRDFFPLTVNYQEKTYAAGRIPGGFFKREGRPSEKETLTSRLIDRPIRPLFPEGFNHDVQVVATVLSLNPEVDSDIPALIGASAALALSGLPFMGPIGAAKVGYANGKYLLNPSATDLKTSELELVVAGTKDGVLMVESEASGLSEEIMLGAVSFGHDAMHAAINAINALAAAAAKPKWKWQAADANVALEDAVKSLASTGLNDAYSLVVKQERRDRIAGIKESVMKELASGETPKFAADAVKKTFGDLEYRIVRDRILSGAPRIDGRDHKTVRPITV